MLGGGHVGVLRDPQSQILEGWLAEDDGRSRILLSHHQFESVYDPRGVGSELVEKVGPLLRDGAVTAWLWGHEHRCVAYASTDVRYPRCIGHGGIPQAPHRPARHDEVVWEELATFEAGGRVYGRFGYAVLDLDAEAITVRYRNDTGAVTHTETLLPRGVHLSPAPTA